MAGPYELQSPKDIAMEYGGNKQKIAQAAQMGLVDPTSAVLAGMFIDRMRNAQQEEMAPQQTVAQEVMAPQQPQMAGIPGAQMAAQMPAEAGVAALPVPEDMYSEDSFAGGGIVAFANGGDPREKILLGYLTNPNAPAAVKELNPDYVLKAFRESPEDKKNSLLAQLSAQSVATPQKTSGRSQTDIEKIISQAERGEGPNVHRPSAPAPMNRVLRTLSDTERQIYDQTKVLPPGAQSMLAPRGNAPILEQKEEVVDDGMPSANLREIDYQSIINQAGGLASALAPDQKTTAVPTIEEASKQTSDLLKESGYDTEVFSKIKEDVQKQREGLKGARSESVNMRLIEAGLAIMGGTSANAFENIGKGATGALKGLAEDFKDLRKNEKDLKLAEQNLMLKQNEAAMGKSKITQSTIDKAQEQVNKQIESYNRTKTDMAKIMLSGEIQERLARASYGSKLTDFDKQWALYSKDAKARGEPATLDGFRRALEGSRSVITPKEATRMAIDALKNSAMDLNTAEGRAEFERLKRYFMEQGGGGAASSAGGTPPPLPSGFIEQ